MQNYPDGRYNLRPWDMSPATAPQPNPTKPEQLTTDRLIAALQTPSLNSWAPRLGDKFRTRFGYRTREIGISDIIDIDRIYGEPRDMNYSGNVGDFSGYGRNSIGNV